MGLASIYKKPHEYNPGEIIIPSDQIDQRIDELAMQIEPEIKHAHALVVGILTGGAWFSVDLVARLFKLGVHDIELTFMKVTSYPNGTNAVHEPRIEYDLPVNPSGRHVLIVDDVVDTGKSISLIEEVIRRKDVLRLQSVVLVDKPQRREITYTATYTGFEIPNIWIQGRGMDTDGYGRPDPNIIKGPYRYK